MCLTHTHTNWQLRYMVHKRCVAECASTEEKIYSDHLLTALNISYINSLTHGHNWTKELTAFKFDIVSVLEKTLSVSVC